MMNYSDAAFLLKAIGEASRLEIIAYLANDALCVCELTALLQMSQPSISQHLKRLRQVELIIEEKRGKWVYYSLNKNHAQYPFVLHLLSLVPAGKDLSAIMTDGKRMLCE